MKNFCLFLSLSLIASVYANDKKCFGQSWTTDTANTFKVDYYFNHYGKPIGYDRFIIVNTYNISETIEERTYAYRYDLTCGERQENIFQCQATYKQMLFRYTDANKSKPILECGKIFHNKFQDTSAHICYFEGRDLFADYKKGLGETTPFTLYMEGTMPALDQDFHHDAACLLKENIPIVLEGAIIAFVLVAVCLVTVFGGILIGSLKNIYHNKKLIQSTGYTESLIV